MNVFSYCLALLSNLRDSPAIPGCSFGAFAFQSCVQPQSCCLKSSHRGGKLRCLFLRLCFSQISCDHHPLNMQLKADGFRNPREY